tara:strand:+ start:164 stop:562 length:399 start_codon:yes stop_codon:yes gene_type:complete
MARVTRATTTTTLNYRKEKEMENKLYRVSLCHFHEQERNPNQYQEFLCVTTVDKIGKILDLYDELWKTLNTMEVLTESVIDGPTSESTIIEELENLDPDALLEDIETGEKFWYVHKYDKDYKVVGYELEPIK